MNSLLKISAQLVLLYVALWALAKASGQGDKGTAGTAGPRNCNYAGGVNPYRGIFSQYGSARAAAYYQPELANAPGAVNGSESWVL